MSYILQLKLVCKAEVQSLVAFIFRRFEIHCTLLDIGKSFSVNKVVNKSYIKCHFIPYFITPLVEHTIE